MSSQLAPEHLISLNALAGTVVLFALQINIPNTETIYLVNNGENITFNGHEYIAFPFNISEVSIGKGESPTLELFIDNTTRIMEAYILQYDLYVKQHGVDGNIITAVLLVLNPEQLSSSILEHEFMLSSFNATAKAVTFSLSAPRPHARTYPPNKILQNQCRFKYKHADGECGATSSLPTCNKTLADCKARGNSSRFGGFAGVGRGIRI